MVSGHEGSPSQTLEHHHSSSLCNVHVLYEDPLPTTHKYVYVHACIIKSLLYIHIYYELDIMYACIHAHTHLPWVQIGMVFAGASLAEYLLPQSK